MADQQRPNQAQRRRATGRWQTADEFRVAVSLVVVMSIISFNAGSRSMAAWAGASGLRHAAQAFAPDLALQRGTVRNLLRVIASGSDAFRYTVARMSA